MAHSRNLFQVKNQSISISDKISHQDKVEMEQIVWAEASFRHMSYQLFQTLSLHVKTFQKQPIVTNTPAVRRLSLLRDNDRVGGM